MDLLSANGSIKSAGEFVGTSRYCGHPKYIKHGDTSSTRGRSHSRGVSGNMDDVESQSVDSASEPQSYTQSTWITINSGLSLLSIQSSSTTFIDPKEKEGDIQEFTYTRKTLVVNFFWGFLSCRRGFRLSVNIPFDSLKLDITRRRPSDSLIFSLCQKGDTNEVKRLLQTGEASIFDSDEIGRGLLHVSILFTFAF